MLTPDNTPSPSPTKVSDPDHEIISFHKMRMSPGACHRVGLGKATQAILRERSTAHDPDHAFVCSLFFLRRGSSLSSMPNYQRFELPFSLFLIPGDDRDKPLGEFVCFVLPPTRPLCVRCPP